MVSKQKLKLKELEVRRGGWLSRVALIGWQERDV